MLPTPCSSSWNQGSSASWKNINSHAPNDTHWPSLPLHQHPSSGPEQNHLMTLPLCMEGPQSHIVNQYSRTHTSTSHTPTHLHLVHDGDPTNHWTHHVKHQITTQPMEASPNDHTRTPSSNKHALPYTPNCQPDNSPTQHPKCHDLPPQQPPLCPPAKPMAAPAPAPPPPTLSSPQSKYPYAFIGLVAP